jgi:hypothetical protein
MMDTFRGIAGRVVAASSCDVYRACGVLHGSEEGPLQSVPLTEDSELRTKLQTYPRERMEMIRKMSDEQLQQQTAPGKNRVFYLGTQHHNPQCDSDNSASDQSR